MESVTTKQVQTLSHMIQWVSLKRLRNNGFTKEHLIKIRKNLQDFKILINSDYIRKYSANSRLIQNIFNYLANLLDRQKKNTLHVIGKDTRPYYTKDSFYKNLDMQKAYYHKHGI